MGRSVTVTFKDGTSHVFNNVPDNVGEGDIYSRATTQFKKPISKVYGGTPPKQPDSAEINVDMAKNRQLYPTAAKQLQIYEQNFDGLADDWNLLGSGFANMGLGGYDFNPLPESAVTGTQFQRGRNAARDLAESYNYSVSGASAPPPEVEGKKENILPSFWESSGSESDKAQRARQWVNSIRERGWPGLVGAPSMPQIPDRWRNKAQAKPRAAQPSPKNPGAGAIRYDAKGNRIP